MKRILTTVFSMLLMAQQVIGQITPVKNTIGIDITLPQNSNYDVAFTSSKNIGMKQTGLFFAWTSLETSPRMFDFSYLDIANVFYPAYNTAVDLTIAPIATNHLEVPSDLAGYPLDHPLVIDRFKTLLDSIFVHIPALQLSSLEIGSEMDIYLGTNAAQWSQYTNFYAAVSAYARILRKDLKVASEATFEGLTGKGSAYMQTLNTYSDYIAVSYYPLNSDFTVKPISAIPIDFENIVDLYPSKPIYFTQYGYPSSNICGSSPTLQAQFIQQTFTSWDEYASHIKMIDFTWMHDLSAASLDHYSSYYGITDVKFLNFLGSLGLRTYSGIGTNKPAYEELICQANQRGYNSLNCITAINDAGIDDEFTIFPNPASSIVYLHSKPSNIISEVIITDVYQQEVYKEQMAVDQTTLHISHLAAGIYFVHMITDTGIKYTEKITVTK